MPQFEVRQAIPLILGATIIFSAFQSNYRLAQNLEAIDVFTQANVLFDTDPHTQKRCFSLGKGEISRSMVHPNLCSLVHPIVEVTARLLSRLDLGKTKELQRTLSLLVSPVAISLQQLLLFGIAIKAGLPFRLALPLLALASVAFSNMVFGSVPEHFALGGLSVTLALYAAFSEALENTPNTFLWLGSGFLAISITVTNLLPVISLLFLIAVYSSGVKTAMTRCMVIVVGSVTMVAACRALFGSFGGVNAAGLNDTLDWTGGYFRDDPLLNFIRSPFALANAIIAPEPVEIANRLAKPDSRYDIQLTLSNYVPTLNGVGLMQFIFLAQLLLGAAIGTMSRRDHVLRPAYFGCLMVIVFNMLLHAIWGNEYFLYSNHWVTASILLMIPLLALSAELTERWINPLSVLFSIFVVVIFLNNVQQLSEMQELLTNARLFH